MILLARKDARPCVSTKVTTKVTTTMTNKQIDQIYNTITGDGSREMTPERFRQAAKEIVGHLHTKRSKPAGNYQDYVGAWFAFYNKVNGINPKFTAADGAALKQIKAYLEIVSPEPETALASWMAILSNYHNLDDFFRFNLDLKFINGQLNKIISQLKHVTTKTRQGHNAADLRGEL
jgi:hypothetical protein